MTPFLIAPGWAWDLARNHRHDKVYILELILPPKLFLGRFPVSSHFL